jgi:hypothetical protein
VPEVSSADSDLLETRKRAAMSGIGSSPQEDAVVVEGTLFLLTGRHTCWKCREEQSVIGLATERLSDGRSRVVQTNDDLVVLSNFVQMPSEVLAFMQSQNGRFGVRYSKMAEESYFANTCECGALFGDFYLHSEPGGAFFPESPEEAAKITLSPIPLSPPLKFDCSCHYGSVGELIREHARRAS